MMDGSFAGKRIFIGGLVLVLSAFMFPPSELFAEAKSVVARVDKNEVTLEDYIVLRLSVRGTREAPTLPDMPDFKVLSRGSSSQVSIVNGRMSSTVEYNYLLYPRKTGSFTIGPFFLKDGKTRINSNTIRLQVRKTPASNSSPRDVFVTATVDNDHPYVHEQIIYSFRFFRAVKITNAGLRERPSFAGFIKEDLGKEREYQKVINGRQFVVTEIKYALFPTKTGVIEISPSVLQCSVVVQKRGRQRSPFGGSIFDDTFFGFSETVPKVLRTKPVVVRVQPLPAADRPAGFKNLVGCFALTSDLSSEKVEQGASVTLTLRVSGTGNLQSVRNIDVGRLQNFKVYDDKPVFTPGMTGGRAGGEVVIKKALVPLVPGKLKIPEISLAYFNPDTGRYEKTVTGPYVMDVAPADEQETLRSVEGGNRFPLKQDIKILGKDILPIHTGVDALEQARRPRVSLWAMLFIVAPVVLFIMVLLLKAGYVNKEAEAQKSRRKNAYKVFRRNFSRAVRKLKSDDPSFFQLLQKALKAYMGDRFGVPGQALTAKEMAALLSGVAIPAEVSAHIKEIMLLCDSGQFGSESYTLQEKEKAAARLRQTVTLIHKQMK